MSANYHAPPDPENVAQHVAGELDLAEMQQTINELRGENQAMREEMRDMKEVFVTALVSLESKVDAHHAAVLKECAPSCPFPDMH